MNILFFTRLYSPHIGGVEKHVEKISQILKKNHRLTIITEQYDKKLKQEETVNGIKVYRIPVSAVSEKQKKWLIWKELWKHKGLIKNTDLVHIHDVFFWYLPFRFLFPRKKVFTTFHGYEGNDEPPWQAIIQHKIAEILSSGSIAIGDFMKQWYHARPNTVSYGAASTKPAKLPKIQNAVFIGRLDHATGILAYLQGLTLLPRPLRLTVYGDGPLLKQAEKLVKTNKLKVTFKGFKPYASTQLKNFRLAFVSRYLSILEAMQTKRLVFAHYNNQIKKDYLTCHPQAKNMILFKTPEQFARQLKKSLNQAEQEKQKIEFAHTWAQNQTWQKLANQYLKLWQR